MFVLCLIIGIMMMVIGLSLLFLDLYQPRAKRLPKQMTRPLTKSRAEKVRMRLKDENDELNLDGFAGIGPMPQLLMNPETMSVECLSSSLNYDLDGMNRCADAENVPPRPSLQLASLIEIQNEERQKMMRIPAAEDENQNKLIAGGPLCVATQVAAPVEPAKPRILGDSACDLGVLYFNELLSRRLVPRGRISATNESNLIIAQNALKSGRQSATLSHGAVAQRIGEKTVCIFEPLEKKIDALDKAMDAYAEILAGKIAFFVLADPRGVENDKLAHIWTVCDRFGISRKNVFIQQSDNTFVNYIEEMNGFVPARIDATKMTSEFFSQFLNYVHDAYDEGDNETVMRVLGPLMGGLYVRAQNDRRFSKLVAAQAFNLMGMTNRDLGHDEEAIHCFDASLMFLRKIEDYEAIKSVQANLGISLALMRPVTPQHIELAIRHLNEVTQLNPYDDECWVYLANSYLEQYRLTKRSGLLRHAYRAYDRAHALNPSEEIASCLAMLGRQLGIQKNVQMASRAANAPVRHNQLLNK